MRRIALVLVGLALWLAEEARADLPNHCLWSQVKGTWTFHMSKGGKVKNERCSKAGTNYGGGDYGLGEPRYDVKKKVEIQLDEPNIAKMTDADGKEHVGTWTMIYDEGFEVRVNSHKFFAFSKYHKSDYGNTKSVCHETFPGWFHDATDPDNHSWGCYHGSKKGGGQEVEHDTLDLERAASLLEVPYKPENDMVDEVNSRPHGKWKAKVYPQFLGKTVREIHQMGGRQLTQPYKALHNNRNNGRRLGQSLDDAPVLLQTDIDGVDNMDVSMLPKQFDWRDVDGKNYIGPVENQGRCGSCYAHASMDALASRIRIKTKNKVKPNLSIENILACSEYSQGCKGGYGFLVGKYAQDFGVPLKGAGEKTCQQKPSKVAARVGDYYYVGGFYGGSTWQGMMHEIHKNGPVVVGFATSGWIYHYEMGVFLDETVQDEAEGGKKKKLHVNPWQHTDHAVIVVGWAEDDELGKFWIVKNSWGKDWGEKGYFRIERGTNAQVIESKPVGFEAEVGDTLTVDDLYRKASLKAYDDTQAEAQVEEMKK